MKTVFEFFLEQFEYFENNKNYNWRIDYYYLISL